MQSTREGAFGYSDFFASGIRTITRTRSSLEAKSPMSSVFPSHSHFRHLSFPSEHTTRTDRHRSKRESFIQFSSDLAERLSTANVTVIRYISTRVIPRRPTRDSVESSDPFASSPEAKSIFIHPFRFEMTPLSMTERESFLAFTDSSAVSLVPIPCRSRSMSNISCELHEKEDTWTLDLEEDQEVDTHLVDWRRFHVDVLLDGSECIA